MRIQPFRGISEREFGGIGEALERAGHQGQAVAEELRRQEELRERRRRARDTADALDLTNQYIQQLDTYAAESLKDPNYREHPTRVRDFSKQLTSDFSERTKGLLPEAQQRFTVETGQYFTILNRQAEQQSFQREAQHTKVIAEEARTVFERGMLETTDPVQQQFHIQRYQDTLDALANDGMIFPEQRTALFREATETVLTRQGELLARTNPQVALEHFQSLATGGPGVDGQPKVPVSELPKLLDTARQERDLAINRSFTLEQRGEKQVKDQQAFNERGIFNQVLDATDVATLDSLQRQVQERAVDRTVNGITDTGQRLLSTMIQTQRKAILSPKEFSDPLAQRAWGITIHTGAGERTPDETQRLMLKVLADPKLKYDDAQAFAKDLSSQLEANHYTKLPGYSESEQNMKVAFITRSPFEQIDIASQRAELFARQQFQRDLLEIIATRGRNAAAAALPELERRAIDAYAGQITEELRTRLSLPPQLPPGVAYEVNPNPDSLTIEDITRRYEEAVGFLKERVARGEVTRYDSGVILEQLTRRQKWEQRYAARQGQPPQRTAPAPSPGPQQQGTSGGPQPPVLPALQRAREFMERNK